MQKNKSIISIIFILLFFIVAFYVKLNWEYFKFKYRYEDFILNSNKKNTNETIEIFKVQLDKKKFDKFKMTDIYYVSNYNEIQFGFIFNKSYYKKRNIPVRYFHVELEDQNKKRYIEGGYLKVSDVFEVFQHRYIKGIDISKIDKLYMYIYPLKIVENQVMRENPIKILVYDSQKNIIKITK